MRRRLLSSLLLVLVLVLGATSLRGEEGPSSPGNAMPENRLATERSPYLRQHRTNPVDWYPWGDEALARARDLERPIFLSVGYAACHWCHVMEHESFEDEATAKLLNETFVCVKVDREERPDLDALYMRAVQIMTGRGGWPMTVILTPAGDPFFAGTYLPRDGLQDLTRRIAELWASRRADLVNQAQMVSERVRDLSDGRDLPPFEGSDAELLKILDTALTASFDPRLGGYGGAPKFPPHTELLYLLDRAARDGDEEGLAQVRRTLDAMADGGIHDQVGGGFHRYSTDAFWLLPHFEKMLYDNALLARVYARAFRATGEEGYAEVAHGILGWIERELAQGEGGYASSLDADTDGEEGLTYTWTIPEIEALLAPEDAAFVVRHYGLRPEGNFHDESSRRKTGRNVLHREQPLAPAERERAAKLLHSLRTARDERAQPGLDDKVITAWNGLLLSAFAVCGSALGDSRYLERGRALADFLLVAARREDGTLLRFPRASGTEVPAFCDDHVHLAEGLLDLAEATGEARFAESARDLGDRLLEHFEDDHAGGFWSTSDALHEKLIARQKETFDGPIPSENGTAARLLLRLAEGSGDARYRKAADRTLETWRPLLGMARAARGTVALYRALADRSAVDAGSPGHEPPSSDATAVTDLLRVDAWVQRLQVRPGARVAVALQIQVADGWHVNPAAVHTTDDRIPTTLRIEGGAGVVLELVTFPPAPRRVLVAGQAPVTLLEGAFALEAALAIPKGTPLGALETTLLLTAQACSDTECQAPRTLRLVLPLVVAAQDGESRHADRFPDGR